MQSQYIYTITNCIFIIGKFTHAILKIILAKTYPRGFAGSMREYSEKFHEISCWHEHPDDYKNILLDFFKFLKVNILYIAFVN